MISIFSIPKPFVRDDDVRQRNAIGSWLRIPGAEVILCGDEDGVADTARELGCRHVAGVRTNSRGTPLLSSAFALVAKQARYPLLCYANCDIILLPSFSTALGLLSKRECVGVSRRINVDLNEAIDFNDSAWADSLSARVRASGQDGTFAQIDLFVLGRDGPLVELPDFAVGRPAWDNWFIWNTRKHDIAIVDISRVSRIIHQNHDYQHVKQRQGKRWEGPEAEENRRLMGGLDRRYTLMDATHVLTRFGMLPALDLPHLRARLGKRLLQHPTLGRPAQTVRRMLRNRM